MFALSLISILVINFCFLFFPHVTFSPPFSNINLTPQKISPHQGQLIASHTCFGGHMYVPHKPPNPVSVSSPLPSIQRVPAFVANPFCSHPVASTTPASFSCPLTGVSRCHHYPLPRSETRFQSGLFAQCQSSPKTTMRRYM